MLSLIIRDSMWSPWASTANTRWHVHNLCMRRVLVRSASVQRGYVRGAPTIDGIHRSREEEETGRGGGRRRVCRARTSSVRTVRIMHRPRMQSACGTNLAPECLRMDGIASLPFPLSRSICRVCEHPAAAWCMCAPGTQRYSRAGVQSTRCRASGERARVNVPRGSLVSFSLPLIASCTVGLPPTRRSSSFLALSFSLIPSFGISSLLFSHRALF